MYQHREILCRSRIHFEVARLLIDIDNEWARQAAAEVRSRVAPIGARPLVEKAHAKLDWIQFRT